MVPVPKLRPPKSVESELRPISLTSPIAEVIEGFSAESLITRVFNKLDNKQFALPGRSTSHAGSYPLYAHYFGNTGHLWQIDTLELSSQTSVKASTLWTTMYC